MLACASTPSLPSRDPGWRLNTAASTKSPTPKKQGRFCTRFADIQNQISEASATLHQNKGHLALIQDAREMERQALHRDLVETAKQAVKPLQAPTREKQMCIKARLARITVAAGQNAQEMEQRSDVLRHAMLVKEMRDQRPPEDFEFPQHLIELPMIKTKEDLKKDRWKSLPPVSGSDLRSRKAAAARDVQAMLSASGRLPKQEDWAWVTRQVEAAPEDVLGVSDAGSCGSQRGLTKSRSAPLLLKKVPLKPPAPTGWHVPTHPRQPRLANAELYPSLKSRVRVVEEHLTNNASELESGRAFTSELRALCDGHPIQST